MYLAAIADAQPQAGQSSAQVVTEEPAVSYRKCICREYPTFCLVVMCLS